MVSGVGSVYKTIQALGGDVSTFLTVDMGIMDVEISNPSRQAGKTGAIRFKRDKDRTTDSNLTVKGVKV